MLDEVLERHSNVLKPGVGLVRDTTATIYVDPTVTPVFCRPRPVPYALRSKVEAELDQLEQEGIIKPVQFAEWAAPIVPVVKTDPSAFVVTIRSQLSKQPRWTPTLYLVLKTCLPH